MKVKQMNNKFESHLYGIETNFRLYLLNNNMRLNRTFMELKPLCQELRMAQLFV